MKVDAHESEWLYGIHDPGGEQIMSDAGTPGWVVYTVAVGRDPSDHSGHDFSQRHGPGTGIICRINNGYYPAGTVPPQRYYNQFAQRCANFVAASSGCRIWIIGNEPNYAIERPYGAPGRAAGVQVAGQPEEASSQNRQSAGGMIAHLLTFLRRMWLALIGDKAGSSIQIKPGEQSHQLDLDPYFHGLPERFSVVYGPGHPDAKEHSRRVDAEEIWPEMYAECYRRCRSAIRAVPGHENDLVITAAIAPWNNQTVYPGNPLGDWVQYFQDVLLQLSPGECDGIALHTYTHGPELERIGSEARMDAPFQAYRFEFRAYRDFLDAVPEHMRDLPVFITETNQVDRWRDRQSGWVVEAYREIDEWNHMALTQKIACLALYRWTEADKWSIVGKQGVINDLRAAMDRRFARIAASPAASKWKNGQRLRTTTIVNLRRSAGYSSKHSSDIIAELPTGTRLELTAASYVVVDALNWWPVVVRAGEHTGKHGWVAETDPYQNRLVESDGEPAPEPGEDQPQLRVGELAHTDTIVRLRRSPGYVNKADDDIITEVAPRTTVNLLDGPVPRDQLTWWRVSIQQAAPSLDLTGWMADTAPDGTRLLLVGEAQPRPRPEEVRFLPGDLTLTVNFVRLRNKPGFMNKPAEDVIADIWKGAAVRILDGPVEEDDLVWWLLETNNEYDGILRGWMADEAPNGVPLLQPLERPTTVSFAPGELIIVNESPVRVRREPGYLDSPAGDVLGEFRRRTVLHVLGGMRTVDDLPWWRVAGVAVSGDVQGWVAAVDPTGLQLLRRAPRLPGTELPSSESKIYLARPFDGEYGIGQLWGENPHFYRRFVYDGVALLGHNGIDFLTPSGTTVRATDAGSIATTGFQPDGFGHYVLVDHGWGHSVYAHLNRVDVAIGQNVAQGAVLGATGTSGNSTGPHLHFAIRIRPFDRADGWGGYSDPLPYMNPSDLILPAYLLGAAGQDGEFSDETHSGERLPPSGIGEESPDYKRP